MVPGKVPGGGQAVPDGQGAARQPGKFPLVRGEDGGGCPSVQYIYMLGQGVYAIGVQHHGDFQVCQQGQDQPLRPGTAPQTGADHRHITAPGPL